MKITASALSLNVPDPEASAKFLTEHFGFEVQMSEDGFVSLTRPDAGFNIVYLRTGLSTFKPERIAGSAGQGTLVAFVVDDIETEYQRVQREGVPIATPIETEPWGERYFQTLDPNGIVIQLVQWVNE
ncbi:VOC family protein [Nocardia mexicana]|uniref:Putative glyoxalase superfamily protein PhnB n=1 Tax=Nocardia mexicana TaxID=279262 RepID=A0A370H7M2_9NOCA|nr:VOC family protein [Nocardia mexicana]RDI52131.1 putative glyoxalase superfamily protein PhnB [Nocardia mexicana]